MQKSILPASLSLQRGEQFKIQNINIVILSVNREIDAKDLPKVICSLTIKVKASDNLGQIPASPAGRLHIGFTTDVQDDGP